ncbi:type IV secretory system conjugative DNA transfer family protein [Runella aurantiaca]|uniref:Type IV secretory system conjugative DNA transfer family protein n=1 Tax=Runella aurantiaca TaxID=2282308 RepID=A0A369I221_9BACT|nr:type IV secretory system conjugative DNA transfer family protein [Runella aurantiaca]RDB02295.1 type IV secretory system conjugative DNA transfer family protein [Runella aurantiaca]
MSDAPSTLSFICLAGIIYVYYRRSYFHDKIFAGVNQEKNNAHLEDLKAGKLEVMPNAEYLASMRGFKIARTRYLQALAYPILGTILMLVIGGNELSFPAAFLTFFTWFKWQKVGGEQYQSFALKHQPPKPKRNELGSAAFSDVPEKYAIEMADSYQVFLGFSACLKVNDKKHILTIAPSRSGKGTCLIVPNLIMPTDNSYVVLDIKGENAAVTARRQKELGKDIVIIDPWGVQENIGAKHGITPMTFNPLALLEGMSNEQLFEECTSIAELIAPMPKNVKDPFWINRARVLIRGLLLHHIKSEMPENWSLLAIYKALRLSEVEFIAHILLGSETPLAADDLNQFKGKAPSEKEFGSIVSSAQDATEFVRNISKGGGIAFNPKQLNEKSTAVYVCIPERAIETNYQWLRLVIGLCVRAISENVKNKQVERTVFLLDEAHYLGNMPEIRKALATSATYGICLWQFYQDIGQVQAAYGDYWHTIMNVGVQQFYKINDLNTQKYVSELLGDYTLELSNTSTNARGEKSRSESIIGTRLLKPEQVGTVPDIITRMDNKNYLLIAAPYYEGNISDAYDPNPLV